MKIIAISIVLLTFPCLVNAQSNSKLRLDKTMDSIAKHNPLPTFIVGGINKNGVFYEYHHGNKIWSKKTPVNDDHIFRIYSMTKAIATVAAMQLVEQGKLQLDQPLDNLLPEMAAIPILTKDGNLVKPNKSITLRHLLTHTAGFAYPFLHNGLDQFSKHMPADYHYSDLPRVFEAGDKWQYGTNINWVGKLVEKVSGKDLETYIHENISKPLGMSRTFFTVPDSLIGEITTFGQLNGEKFEADTAWQYKDLKPKTYDAGGGLFSTFHDYAQFIRCILNDGTLNKHQILKKSTIDVMFENNMGSLETLLEDPTNAYPFLTSPNSHFLENNKFGIGWAIDQNGRKGIRNPGTVFWSGIANTFYSIDRKRGKAVLFFSNTLPFSNQYAESANFKAEGAIYNIK